jgi:FkbM family methyltransferase
MTNMKEVFYGQFDTDKIIKNYFLDKPIGNCIEVGACDGIMGSNTFHFELNGWNCLCIEPIPAYYTQLKNNRQNTLNLAVSNSENDSEEFNLVSMGPNLSAMSGLELDNRLLEQHKQMGYHPEVEKIFVKTKKLEWCIENHFNHETIDFISIDTEGTELDVLKSFDVNKYNIKLLVIENNFNESEIEEYLKSKGWIKNKRIEVNDFYIKN